MYRVIMNRLRAMLLSPIQDLEEWVVALLLAALVVLTLFPLALALGLILSQ